MTNLFDREAEKLHPSLQNLYYNLHLIDKVQLGYDGNVSLNINFDQIKELKKKLWRFRNDLETIPDFHKYSQELSSLESYMEKFGNLHKEYPTYDDDRQLRVYEELKKRKEGLEQVFEDFRNDLKLKVANMEKSTIPNKESEKLAQHSTSHIQAIDHFRELELKLSDLKSFLQSFQSRFNQNTKAFILIEKCLDSDNELLNFWKELDKDFKDDNTDKALIQLRSEITTKKQKLTKDLEELEVTRTSKRQDATYQIEEHGGSEQSHELRDLRESFCNMECFIEKILKGLELTYESKVEHEAISDFHERFSKFINELDDYEEYLDDIPNFKEFLENFSNLIDELSGYKKLLKNERKCYGLKSFDSKLRNKKKQLENVFNNFSYNLQSKLSKLQKTNTANIALFGNEEPAESAFQSQRDDQTTNHLRDLSESLSIFNNDLKEFQSVLEGPTKLCIDLDKCLQLDDELSRYWNELKHTSRMNQQTLSHLYSKIQNKKDQVEKIYKDLTSLTYSTGECGQIALQTDEQTTENLHLSFQNLYYNFYLIDKVQLVYDGNLSLNINFDQIKELETNLWSFRNDLETVPAFHKYFQELSSLETYMGKFENLHKEYPTYDEDRQLRVYVELKNKKKALEQVFEGLEHDLKRKSIKLEKSTFPNKESEKLAQRFTSRIQAIEHFRGLKLKFSDLKSFLQSFQGGFNDLTSVFIIIDKCLDSDNEILNFWKKLDKDFKDDNTGTALVQLRSEITKKIHRLLKDLREQGRLRSSKKQDATYQVEEHGGSEQSEIHSKTHEQKEEIKKLRDSLENLCNMEYFIEQISKILITHKYTIVDNETVSDFHERFSKFMSKLKGYKKYLDNILDFKEFLKNLSELIVELSDYKKDLKNERKNTELKSFETKFRKKKKRLEKFFKYFYDILKSKLSKLQETNTANVALFGNEEPAKSAFQSQKDDQTTNHLRDLFESLSIFDSDLKQFQSVIEGPTRLCIDLDKCLQLDDELSRYWNDLKHTSRMNQQILSNLYSKINNTKNQVEKIHEDFTSLTSSTGESGQIALQTDEQTTENLHPSLQNLYYNLHLIDKVQLGYDGNVILGINFYQIKELETNLWSFRNDLGTVPDFHNYSQELSSLETYMEKFGNLHKEYPTYDEDRQLRVCVELKKKKEALEQAFESLENDLKLKSAKLEKSTFPNKESEKLAQHFTSRIQAIDYLRGLELKLSDLKSFLQSFQSGFSNLTSVFIIIDKCLDSDNELLNFWKKLDKDFEDDNTGTALIQLRSEISMRKQRVSKDLGGLDEPRSSETRCNISS